MLIHRKENKMSQKGYKQTIEHIKNRDSGKFGFKEGCIPWNKNRKLSNNHKKNLSNAHKGYEMPEKQKINIRNSLIDGFKNGTIKKQHRLGEKANNWMGGKQLNKECLDCGGEINYRSERCKECNYKYRIGKNHQNWKGGKTKELKAIRNSKSYLEWREAVFIRDDYTCQKCFIRGCYLHAHHIKQAAFYPELMLDVNNGITLCEGCHKDIPVILRLNKEVDTA